MDSKQIVCVIHPDSDISRSIVETIASPLSITTRRYAKIPVGLADSSDVRLVCIISAFHVEGLAGAEVLAEFERRGCNARVVFFGDQRTNIPETVAAMRSGAVSVLQLPVDANELRAAVQEAVERTRHDQAKRERREEAIRRLGQLSNDEMAVAEMTVEGLATADIARRLDAGVRTIERRRHHVYRKTGVCSAVGLSSLLRDARFKDA